MRTRTPIASGSGQALARPDDSDRRRRARRDSRTKSFCECRDRRPSPLRSAARSTRTAPRRYSSSLRTKRGELLEHGALLLRRMAFVVALDQRLDDADLELG